MRSSYRADPSVEGCRSIVVKAVCLQAGRYESLLCSGKVRYKRFVAASVTKHYVTHFNSFELVLLAGLSSVRSPSCSRARTQNGSKNSPCRHRCNFTSTFSIRKADHNLI
jgi:hypothetical protein